MRVTFYGNATVSLQHDGVCLLVDPWFAGEPWFRPNPYTPSFPEGLRPDLLLVTHGHGDHLGDAVGLSQRSGVPILAPRELSMYCTRQGATASGGQPGGTTPFEWGSVKMVQAIHASATGPNYENVGLAVGYVIRVGGKVIYHAGDTALFGDMKLIGESASIDLAFLPIGGYFTMDVEDALRAVRLLHPRVVVPIHYGTFPPMTGDPHHFRRLVESETDARCVVLQPGESLSLE